jgi:hypothetical protein
MNPQATLFRAMGLTFQSGDYFFIRYEVGVPPPKSRFGGQRRRRKKNARLWLLLDAPKHFNELNLPNY